MLVSFICFTFAANHNSEASAAVSSTAPHPHLSRGVLVPLLSEEVGRLGRPCYSPDLSGYSCNQCSALPLHPHVHSATPYLPIALQCVRSQLFCVKFATVPHTVHTGDASSRPLNNALLENKPFSRPCVGKNLAVNASVFLRGRKAATVSSIFLAHLLSPPPKSSAAQYSGLGGHQRACC